MRNLAILGSTGSIGQQTLDVVRAFPKRLKVFALASGNNHALLAKQVAEFKPKLVCCHMPGRKDPLRAIDPGLADVPYAFESIEAIAAHPEVDLVVLATAGKEGLLPLLAAIGAGKTVALANKESLIMAGHLIIAECRHHQARILPVDSEHSAVWQCLRGEKGGVNRLVLTASGGAFRDLKPSELASVSPEEALAHPTWKMGKKVTVDSATLMNKGLEVIEAHWLFGVPYNRIKVVLHPESIIHSMVEFAGGSVKAQMSQPDMRLPIQYALTYPERWPNQSLPHIDWSKQVNLNLRPIDYDRYPCLRLALAAGRKGGTYPAALSAADDVAVDLFLKHRIGFLDIPRIVGEVLEEHQSVSEPSLDQILAADAWAREKAMTLVEKC